MHYSDSTHGLCVCERVCSFVHDNICYDFLLCILKVVAIFCTRYFYYICCLIVMFVVGRRGKRRVKRGTRSTPQPSIVNKGENISFGAELIPFYKSRFEFEISRFTHDFTTKYSPY